MQTPPAFYPSTHTATYASPPQYAQQFAQQQQQYDSHSTYTAATAYGGGHTAAPSPAHTRPPQRHKQAPSTASNAVYRAVKKQPTANNVTQPFTSLQQSRAAAAASQPLKQQRAAAPRIPLRPLDTNALHSDILQGHTAIKLFVREIHSINDQLVENHSVEQLRISRALQRMEDYIGYLLQLLRTYNCTVELPSTAELHSDFTPEIMYEYTGAERMFTSMHPSPAFMHDICLLNMLRFGPDLYRLPTLRYRPSGFQLLRTHECLVWPTCETHEREQLAKNQMLFVYHLLKANHTKLSVIKRLLAQKKQQQFQRERGAKQRNLSITTDSDAAAQQQQELNSDEEQMLLQEDPLDAGAAVSAGHRGEDSDGAAAGEGGDGGESGASAEHWYVTVVTAESEEEWPGPMDASLRQCWTRDLESYDVPALHMLLQDVMKDLGWLNTAHKQAKQTLREVQLKLDNTPYSSMQAAEQPSTQREGKDNTAAAAAAPLNQDMVTAVATAVATVMAMAGKSDATTSLDPTLLQQLPSFVQSVTAALTGTTAAAATPGESSPAAPAVSHT